MSRMSATESPRVSVAMATYNGMPYLPEQLESILRQSKPADEIVICDDCSSDSTWPYLLEQAAKHPTIRLFRNERNLRSTKNFERAITACSGDVIFLSDQDDVWVATKIEEQLSCMVSTGAALVMSDAELVAANGQPIGVTLWQANGITKSVRHMLESNQSWRVLPFNNFITGCATCFDATLRSLFIPIPESVWHDAWMAAVVAIAFPGRIALLDRKLTGYRQHERNQIGATAATAARPWLTKALRELRSFDDVRRAAESAQKLVELIQRNNFPMFSNVHEFQRLTAESNAHREFRISYVQGKMGLATIIHPSRLMCYFRYSKGVSTLIRDVMVRTLGTGRTS